VANAGPADFQVQANRLTQERLLLASSPHFLFERIDLAANSTWRLEAERETWLLILSGSAVAGQFEMVTGVVVFAQSDHIEIHTGAVGMVGLVAYTGGGPVPHLVQRLTQLGEIDLSRPPEAQLPPSLAQSRPGPKNRHPETAK
jgi:mannose-6-phosphate isomerase